MIVCSCNRVTDQQIDAQVDRLLADDMFRMLTPVVIYKGIGVRPRCGGCLPHAANLIQARAECVRSCIGCPLIGGPRSVHRAAEVEPPELEGVD